MKVTKEAAAAHRDALLQQAGRLFRRRGIEAVSLAEVSRAAGLTHGAFYGHFPSKTALAAEATAASLEGGAQRWRRRAARARAAGTDPLAAIIDAYLSPAHRDAPEDGCALAALGPEIVRAEPPLGTALRGGVGALLEVLGEEIASLVPILSPSARHDMALGMLAAMTGGLVLARALAADAPASMAALRSAAATARAVAPPFPG